MARPSKKTPEQKLQIVLSVLRGEHTVVDAARRNGVSEQLKAALGEAHVQLRVWKKGAEYLPPSRTSR